MQTQGEHTDSKQNDLRPGIKPVIKVEGHNRVASQIEIKKLLQ